MAILKVARLGHPVLREVSQPVPAEAIQGAAIQQLIDDLIDTCREYDGAGLAAPQVHVPLRVALMEVASNPRFPGTDAFPLTIVVNPEITPLSVERMHVWEGCLSVPDLRGLVPRFRGVRLRGLDRAARPIDLELEGFPAAVVQHECDHLDGKVFLDRMTSMDSLHFIREFERYIRPTLKSPVAD